MEINLETILGIVLALQIGLLIAIIVQIKEFRDTWWRNMTAETQLRTKDHNELIDQFGGVADDYNVPFVEVLKNLVDLISIKNLNVVVLDKDLHEIDIEFFDNFILKKID